MIVIVSVKFIKYKRKKTNYSCVNIHGQNENIKNIGDDAEIIFKQMTVNKAGIIKRLNELQTEIREDKRKIRI